MAPPEDPSLSFLGPVVPEGGNPYATFDAFFEEIVWPQPSPGYKIRVGVLGSLLAYMVIVSLALLAVMAVFQRDRFWVFRLVKREGARYIVGNSQTLIPIFAISLAPSLFGNIATDAYTYLHHGEQSSSDSWSVSLFPILFAGSWLWSCSGLQAFLLAGGDRRLPVGPKVANIAFLGGLTAGVAAMTALAVVGSHISVKKSEAFFRMDRFIHSRWSAYDKSGGVVQPGDLQQLYTLAKTYDDAVDSYQALFIRLLYVFAATPFCIGFINLGTLALFLLVRRQVADSRDTFRPFGFIATFTHQDRAEGSTATSEIRSAASRTDQELARRMQQLEEVQDELLLTCLAHYAFMLALFVSTIWIATQFQDQGLTGWARMEAISLLPGWICSVFFSTFVTVRLYRIARGIIKRRRERPSPPRVEVQRSRRPEELSEKCDGPDKETV